MNQGHLAIGWDRDVKRQAPCRLIEPRGELNACGPPPVASTPPTHQAVVPLTMGVLGPPPPGTSDFPPVLG